MMRYGIGVVAVLLGVAGLQAGVPEWDVMADTWVATDGLGRALPIAEEVGPARAGKTVGIFYFLWLGQHSKQVWDISKLLANDPLNPRYGPVGAFHWWGEPWFGYYRSDDPFVIRKHAQMLADAGVDVLFLDVTNAFTYQKVYTALCEVHTQIRKTGQRTPQIAFIAHSREAEVVKRLYGDFYSKKLYPDLWFRWHGKPLILASPEGVSPEIRDFFTFRKSWAWSVPRSWFGDGKDKWTWVDHYPQKPGWHDQPDKPEQISVCVAQHPTSNIGRSFHNGKQPPADQFKTNGGLCFSEQWKRALEVDPQLIFVTGWNEWVAQRFTNGAARHFLGKKIEKGDTFFVDQYNAEYSRDAEPVKGGHEDAYYYQMVANIRRYKGARTIPAVQPAAIVLDGKFEDWKGVSPEFRDMVGDPVQRDFSGVDAAARPYVNTSGRNDIVASKVSWDARNVCFYVRTTAPLSAPTDPNWMMLFIDTDQKASTGWLGYDVVVSRVNVRAGTTTLERHAGAGYRWGSPVEVSYRTSGNEMELTIPRSVLGITHFPATLDFKWTDNIRQTGEASDLTLNGDVAPNDRYNYRARLAIPGSRH